MSISYFLSKNNQSSLSFDFSDLEPKSNVNVNVSTENQSETQFTENVENFQNAPMNFEFGSDVTNEVGSKTANVENLVPSTQTGVRILTPKPKVKPTTPVVVRRNPTRERRAPIKLDL